MLLAYFVLSEMPDPVIHHIELCVFDAEKTLNRLKKFGFNLFAKKQTAFCKQLVARLNTVIFLITEKNVHYKKENSESKKNFGEEIRSHKTEPLTLCCDHSPHVDTVFNLALNVKRNDVKDIYERVCKEGGQIIPPTEISDENGTVQYSIVKSKCGNVIHTLLNIDDYNGEFLPGFEILDSCQSTSKRDLNICGIDHVTLASYSGHSEKVINFYEKCFRMNRFKITSNDDETNGLIISEGVGLRLRAMEYWRCSETGLSYRNEESNQNNSFLLVVVESLEGQTNCNVEEFLRHHRGEGIEHIAFKCNNIIETVSKLKSNGVVFRNPPTAYYDELRNLNKMSGLGVDLNRLSQYGILIDNEDDSTDKSPEKKYLMQIFAKPLFDLKTFFIEIIERSGARGLGSGNILALVRSIREEERRNKMKSEAKTQEIIKENFTSPRQC
ncbi:unnamed protein product [Larinioides sclopetarius]|uniref:VOC domain-containing protein n=1 Tax=Larinioides sclopetarius TaxID=280406 RepID=A0AAV1YRH9_9ARAC